MAVKGELAPLGAEGALDRLSPLIAAGLAGLQPQPFRRQVGPGTNAAPDRLAVTVSKNDTLRYGPPGEGAVHLCVDMQRMYSEATEWKMPWLPRVLPNIVEITSAHVERTVFTRFIPARKPGQGVGMWRHYYERWASMTIEQVGPDMVGLVPDLMKFVPPARIFDKRVYSPWTGSDLHLQLRDAGIATLVITGGETDVCVLATILGAIDWGFRVILVTDALCSSADETHDAMMNIYLNRFGGQIETVTTGTLKAGPGNARARRAS